jgi:DNA (cytosine-5)-methyltransferase 1
MIGSRSEHLIDFPLPTHSRFASALGSQQWVSLFEFLSSAPAPQPDEVVRPSASRLHELERLRPGTGIRASGIVEANRPSGHWGYRQDCFLADPSLPSRTIRAAATPDWIRLDDGSLRRLTWRECAGLQGFPEGWLFEGTVASRFRQIGNAVQGQAAYAIGSALRAAAIQRVRARPRSAPWPDSFHRRVRYTAMEEAVNGAHRVAARMKSIVA